MKLKLEKQGWRWILAFLIGALAAGGQFYAGRHLGAGLKTNLMFSGALGAAAAAALLVRAELKSWWSVLLELVCTAFASLLLLHFVLVNGRALPRDVFVNNMAISLAVVLLGTAITGWPRLISIFWLIFCWGFGMADCAVYQFRGNLITLSDLYSIGTALDVAGNYTFTIVPRMLTVTLVLAILLLILFRCRVEKRYMRKWQVRVLILVLAAVSAWRPVSLMKTSNPNTYGLEGAYYEGLLMNALTEVKLLFVQEPENYSAENVHAALKQYEDAVPAGDTAEEDPPHVIVIMVEALSDLTAAGEFETSEPVMPFTEEFLKETIHGYALSPVVGGGTCNSEWEFLTGNSNIFVPYHANVYRLFVRGEVNSLVKVFDNMGYTCIGMHPANAANWDRLRVYPLMGFEKTYFSDDTEWGEKVRKFVSDRAYVQKLIEIFEAREQDEKLFMFGITMQNHSGYTDPDFEETVRVEGLKKEYPDANQYLSLLQLTDNAIEDLITYFKGSDEKVQIVIFGDHQPRVDGGFYEEIGADEVQDKFTVPYFLWKNYEEDAAEMPMTSLNYLPVMMMESMGIDMPEYYDFLSELRQTLPALNRHGYMTDGVNVPLEEAQGEVLEALNRYEMLQYANMFDKEISSEPFIGKAD